MILPLSPISVWGLPLLPITTDQALQFVDVLIDERKPTFIITANLNYAMICYEEPALQELNRQAAFLLADGMPLVWASRWKNNPLPERVAGADLVWLICQQAAQKQRRIFILGGLPGQADQAAEVLKKRLPDIQIGGTFCPPFRAWSPEESQQMNQMIRASKSDILFVAFGQPKGELWIAQNLQELQVPLSIQIGGSFDFITGRVKRAPQWMQKSGLEWFYRFSQEPGRLFQRYASNIFFIWRMTLGSLFYRPRFPKS